MNIKFNTNFSKSRMESFYRFHFLYKSYLRIVEVICELICLIVSFLGLVISNTYLFAIFLVLFFVIMGTRKYRIERVAKKIINKNSIEAEPYTIIIKDDKIIFNHNNNYQEYKNNEVLCVCEIDECFYIYIGSDRALICPKFVIKASDKEKLREYFSSKFDYKKYKFISSVQDDGDLKQ